ncbi:integrase core domain-containing protein [Halomonas piscis]
MRRRWKRPWYIGLASRAALISRWVCYYNKERSHQSLDDVAPEHTRY